MSIPIAVNDILQVTTEGTNERSAWAMVCHVIVGGITDVDAHMTAIDAWMANLHNALSAHLTTEWIAECIKVSRVAPAPMGVRFINDSWPIPGSVATDGVPNGSAAVVRFNSDEIGPSNRGRCFLCGIPEASTNGGQLTGGALASIQADFDSWLPGYLDGSDFGNLVIFSRALYGTDPPGHPVNVADYTSPVTRIEVQANLGTIRRRRYPRNATA